LVRREQLGLSPESVGDDGHGHVVSALGTNAESDDLDRIRRQPGFLGKFPQRGLLERLSRIDGPARQTPCGGLPGLVPQPQQQLPVTVARNDPDSYRHALASQLMRVERVARTASKTLAPTSRSAPATWEASS